MRRFPQNTYKAKTWNTLCDVCGFKFKSSDLRKRWDGFMTCDADWEPRQPQDLLRAVKETSNTLPWTRPDIDGANIGPSYITLYIDVDYYELLQPVPPGSYYEQL